MALCADTNPDLLDCIMEYAHSRGGGTMESICIGLDFPRFGLSRNTEFETLK
jgi:hypothetical protein